jgi:hypothetical protein
MQTGDSLEDSIELKQIKQEIIVGLDGSFQELQG